VSRKNEIFGKKAELTKEINLEEFKSDKYVSYIIYDSLLIENIMIICPLDTYKEVLRKEEKKMQ